jgi:hypothetical protein
MSLWSRLTALVLAIAAAPAAIGLIGAVWRKLAPGARTRSRVPPPPLRRQPAPPSMVQRIGIILVHGIGEQRRFQHLDSQMRGLIRALHSLQRIGIVQQVSGDISPSGAAAFAADQDTWNSGPGPSVSVTVDHTLNGAPERARLLVHEVWWADVNEPYSLAKQFRFWLWGLAIWALPERPHAHGLGTASRVAPPVVPQRSWLWDRLRLWMVGLYFMLLGYSIGTASFLASRLFNWQTPNVLRTMANYISAVKLYNQQRRYGPGLFWKREEFLDSIDEPPRVSIRRRMIRTIADVASNRYHRWYVLAHSQGTVVAFNGLMETAYSWPGYLDEARWETLKQRRMAGTTAPGTPIPSPPFMPRRPGWAQPDEIVYRSRIFSRFRGFLTYGSPLEKFAGLWPALVPISRERTFPDDLPWVNVYDSLDPVSGKLDAFRAQPRACCPRPTDYGYAADWGLLIAHLHYLTHRSAPRRSGMPDDLATRTIRWMLTNDPLPFASSARGWALGTWYRPGDAQERIRVILAWSWWIGSAAVLAVLGAIALLVVVSAARSAGSAIWSAIITAVTGGIGS